MLVCMVCNTICYVKPLPNLLFTFGLLRLVHLQENRFWVRASPQLFELRRWIPIAPLMWNHYGSMWPEVALGCTAARRPDIQPSQHNVLWFTALAVVTTLCAVWWPLDMGLSCTMSVVLEGNRSVEGLQKRNKCSRSCGKYKHRSLAFFSWMRAFFCMLSKGWVKYLHVAEAGGAPRVAASPRLFELRSWGGGGWESRRWSSAASWPKHDGGTSCLFGGRLMFLFLLPLSLSSLFLPPSLQTHSQRITGLFLKCF